MSLWSYEYGLKMDLGEMVKFSTRFLSCLLVCFRPTQEDGKRSRHTFRDQVSIIFQSDQCSLVLLHVALLTHFGFRLVNEFQLCHRGLCPSQSSETKIYFSSEWRWSTEKWFQVQPFGVPKPFVFMRYYKRRGTEEEEEVPAEIAIVGVPS